MTRGRGESCDSGADCNVFVSCSVDPSEVNISDEMAKSGIWKSVSMTCEGSRALRRSSRYEEGEQVNSD